MSPLGTQLFSLNLALKAGSDIQQGSPGSKPFHQSLSWRQYRSMPWVSVPQLFHHVSGVGGSGYGYPQIQLMTSAE